jgi:phosphoribosylaminoimidazole-succinocarboxamide synthase
MDGPGLPLVYRGKVRDLYDAGDGRLLMVASDRLSAFDVVMAEPVPDKGRVLTAMSAFWFELLGDLGGNHLVSTELDALPAAARDPGLAGRIMLVRRCEMLPVECIVRGYLAGTGWQEYREAGTVCGLPLPAGLREAEQLPAPIFTPSTKAAVGILHRRKLAAAQWSQTVRFRETIEQMVADGVGCFVEVGPSGNLSAFVNDIPAGKTQTAMASNLRRRDGVEQLLTVLAQLYGLATIEEDRAWFLEHGRIEVELAH